MTAPRAQEPLSERDELAVLVELYADQPEDVADRILAAGYRRASSADTRRLVATAFTEGAKWGARNSHLSYYGWHDAMNIAARKYADAAMTQEAK